MDSKTYFTLKIDQVSSSKEDVITGELFDGGASGVQENLQFTQLDKTYKPHVVDNESKTLLAYFEDPPSMSWLENFQSQYPELKLACEEHERVDWLSRWKEQWKPFELISDVWIVPDWHKETFKPNSGHMIFIEPGMAFGTGTHATTRLAAKLINNICKDKQIKKLLDVGTGSGILALLAYHLEVESIFAYDNDKESFRVFSENAEKNSVANFSWVELWSVELKGQCDLTVANIIDGVLLNLKPQFQELNSPYYIFTGILKEREKDFLEEMLEEWPLKVLERLEDDEWVGFLMENNQ